MKIEFTEVQHFRQWWLWLILIIPSSLPFIGIYKQIYKGETWGDKPMSDTVLIIFACLMLAMLCFLWMIKLKTHIDKSSVQVQFFPFRIKQISWSEIQSIRVLEYGFVGGWGIRLGTRFGTVYNVRGKYGIAIELNDGSKFLIGTQKLAEAKNVIKKAKNL